MFHNTVFSLNITLPSTLKSFKSHVVRVVYVRLSSKSIKIKINKHPYCLDSLNNLPKESNSINCLSTIPKQA